jgi:hypothetical protein
MKLNDIDVDYGTGLDGKLQLSIHGRNPHIDLKK